MCDSLLPLLLLLLLWLSYLADDVNAINFILTAPLVAMIDAGLFSGLARNENSPSDTYIVKRTVADHRMHSSMPNA